MGDLLHMREQLMVSFNSPVLHFMIAMLAPIIQFTAGIALYLLASYYKNHALDTLKTFGKLMI